MKNIIVFTVISLIQPFMMYAQQPKKDYSFHLLGFMDGVKEITAILSYMDSNNNRKSDTVISESGLFRFSGDNFEPSWAFLKLTSDKVECSTGFMLGNGDQTIKINKDGHIYDIIGNNLHKEYMRLTANGADLSKEIDFIKRRPESPLASILLNSLIYQKKISVLKALQLFDNLSNDNKRSRIGKYVQREIQIRTVPRIAPDFIINDTLKLSDLKGKLILLDFWASWCIPCREETPKLKELFQKYKNKLIIVTISLDENKEKWLAAIKHDHMDEWINILRTNLIKKEYLNDTEHPIPMLVLIDDNGIIMWNTIHGAKRTELKFVVEKTINKDRI